MIRNLKTRLLVPVKDLDLHIEKVIAALSYARLTIFFAVMVFFTLTQQNFLYQAKLQDALGVNTPPMTPAFNTPFIVYAWFGVYGVVVFLSLMFPNWQKQERWEAPNISSVVDITMMVWLMHIVGGVTSGLGLLVLPFLSMACLLSYGRYWSLYSAYAMCLILLVMSLEYMGLEHNQKNLLFLLSRAGILIIACYSVSALTSFSASYMTRLGETARKHLSDYERISALNKVVLNRTEEAVLVVDKNSKIWHFNRQASHYFPNVKAQEVMPFVRDIIRQWINRPNRPFETNLMINNEDMSVRAVPMNLESNELLILFIRAEKELQAAAQSVKLASLGLLTANLAHEIRNPLSAMRQANGLLTENAENDPMTTKLTTIIDKNIERIDKMIEEVSILNKSDRVNKEIILLSDFWKSFRQEFVLTKPEAEQYIQANIAFRVEVVFDPLHLNQILWNLFNNAWRHCTQSQPDSIKMIAQPVSNYQVSICVFDDGDGIPNDIAKHIFEPFFTTQSQAQGTGLGLYVARELAHANKGDLRYLTSKKAFEIILPRADQL